MPWNTSLSCCPATQLPQRPEVDAEVDVAGGLQAGQDSGHAVMLRSRPASQPAGSPGRQVTDGVAVVPPLLVEDDVQAVDDVRVGPGGGQHGSSRGAVGRASSSALADGQPVADQPLPLGAHASDLVEGRIGVAVDAHLVPAPARSRAAGPRGGTVARRPAPRGRTTNR